MTAVQNNHTHINKQKVIISIWIFSRITGKWKSLNFTRGMQSICQSVLIRYCVTSAKHIDEILIPPDSAIISSSLRILMWSPLYVPLKQVRCKIGRLSIAVSRKWLIWPRPKATYSCCWTLSENCIFPCYRLRWPRLTLKCDICYYKFFHCQFMKRNASSNLQYNDQNSLSNQK